MTLELHATPEEVMRSVETLQDFARAQGLPEKTTFGLALALERAGSPRYSRLEVCATNWAQLAAVE